jgi:Ca2+-binding RTX toxin-like protein
MADVTVGGGSGNAPVGLNYSSQDTAYLTALALAQFITQEYGAGPVDYYPNPNTGDAPYLIVSQSEAVDAKVNAQGFSAVTVQNNLGPVTVTGGGSGSQIVLAADGGMDFTASTGNTTVVAGGGNNRIVLGSGIDEAITSSGNDTIISGSGFASINAGGGDNKIKTGTGGALVTVEGNDTINAGSGLTAIQVVGSGTAYVFDKTGGTILFSGGGAASTVFGGSGTVTATGGAGGGLLKGGSLGDNSRTGGSGAVTIVGGGGGDTLSGGSGSALIQAGLGNETLNAGSGTDEFVFKPGHDGGAGAIDTINNFDVANDVLWVGPDGPDAPARNYALDHQTISNGNDIILLQDGTKLVLQGVSVELGSSSII